MAKKQKSGMDLSAKDAMKSMVFYNRDGNPVYAGDWVLQNDTTEEIGEVTATGEEFADVSSDDEFDVGIATGEDYTEPSDEER